MREHPIGIGFAHAKVVLFGEHAVLYGVAAAAIPVKQLTMQVTASLSAADDECWVTFAGPGALPAVDPRRRADAPMRVLVSNTLAALGSRHRGVNLVVDCGIPQARGLGSSAAGARAVVLALADLLDRHIEPQVCHYLIQSSEQAVHGKSSGVDAAAVAASRPILFRDGVATDLAWGVDALVVIADSGVAASTQDAVGQLRRRFEQHPGRQAEFVDRALRIVRTATDGLARGDLDAVGRAFTRNHELLRDVELSSAALDALVDSAVAAGSPGAKLTGGGLGGCVLALARDLPQASEIAMAFRRAGATSTWTVAPGRVLSLPEFDGSRP
ncbi:mevalonate kinase [Nocardia brasiliensis]|uniref:mevalonate kinase n=1 Tax=Nocardia brasiliensis (strain ATCC 700358 / HUJEG-1) TaxID=1133849 RepID=K0ER76_NOCB7|nr:mevalonate kinase [Nocardia brasiliensis]AFT99548.1 Mevalonate kinase [Nocardia brasiliensis ATCC 700358]OCF90496.1 hypothetical protein AW168_11045 [Nocardia brasiliensis]